MIPMTFSDMQLLIAAVLFFLGCLSIMLGAFILIARGYSSEIKTIATHTARLGHKGLSKEVTGLVTSASGLIEALNQLVRTASGVGVFLIFFGMLMIAAAYWIISQISPVAA
jgi:Trk-type K+ transport system membrane component